MNADSSNADQPIASELLGQIVDRHAAALTLFARTWTRWPEDVVQEALVELARQPRLPDNVLAWLYRVVRNRAISAARSAQRRRRHEQTAGQLQPAWFVRGDETTVDAHTAARALAELPVDEREVIVAHLWGGLTFTQIAEVVGMPSSTAHRRYVAGLARLREKLGPIEKENASCPISTKNKYRPN